MAKRSSFGLSQKKLKAKPKRTSIGKSIRSKPKNKHKRGNYPYISESISMGFGQESYRR